jgi:hypothetical protein
VPTSNSDTEVVFDTGNQSPDEDVSSTFTLNELVFDPLTSAFTLTGGSLDFVSNSSSAAPMILQDAFATETIDENISLGATTTMEAQSSPAGTVIFNNPVTSSSASMNFDSAIATFNNTYSVAASSTFQGGASVTFNAATTLAQTTTFSSSSVTFNSTINSLGSTVLMNSPQAAITLDSSVTVPSLKMTGGTISGTGTLTATQLEWDEGSMMGSGTTIASNGITFNGLTDTGGFDELNRTLDVYGTSSVTSSSYQGHLYFGTAANLVVESGAVFNASQLGIQGSDIVNQTWGTFTNLGTLVVDNPAAAMGFFVTGSALENKGVIKVTNGTLYTSTTLNTSIFNQDGGSIILSNGTLSGSAININSGSLSGYGSLQANINNSGTISPTGGILSLGTELTLEASSTLSFSLGGTTLGTSFGQIDVIGGGDVILGGQLEFNFANGFQSEVTSGETFALITGASPLSGEFANVTSGERLESTDGSGSFIVTVAGGNLILSNYVATPEPSSFWELATGLLLLAGNVLRARNVNSVKR